MQTVILAGGLATRLRPLTDDVPKSMIEIDGKPFLQYQLELLRENGIYDVVLCVGHLSQMIKNYFGNGVNFGIKIRYSDEGENPLGTGGALKKAYSLLNDHFFLMYGDSYLRYDYRTIESHTRRFPRFCILVVYKNDNQYDNSNIAIKNGLISVYDKNNSDGKLVYIDSGLSVLRKEFLSLIPPDKPSPLEDLYRRIIEEKKMLGYEVKQRFYEIGSPRGLMEFKTLVKKHSELAYSS